MKKIVIFGASGLLGHWLTGAFKLHPDLEIIKVGRSTANDVIVDLTKGEALLSSLNDIKPDVILNLAAETNVDFCENHPEKARAANVGIPKNISEYLRKNSSCKSIHISTDHVYDGEGLKKEDQTSLKNAYAVTKFEGENYLNQRSFILRTNFFGRSSGEKDSFSDWIVKSFKSGSEIKLFNDSYFSPVHWTTIYEAILKCIDSDQFGIYNLGSSTCISKADFAVQVATELGVYHKGYQVVGTNDVDGRVQRPLNMCMDSSKIAKAFGIKVGTVKVEIGKLKKEYL